MDKIIPEAVKDAAMATFPQEVCGFVVRRGKKSVWVNVPNSSKTPMQTFQIAPDEYARVADTGEIIGIWHTHPNGNTQPTDADRVGCELSDLPWYIVSVRKEGESFVFAGPEVLTPCGFVMPYLERPYVFGVFDCWSLVRDYYARDLGIILRDHYPRIEFFWKHGFNFFGEGWKEDGFTRFVNDEEPQVGDIFLIQTNHFGVPDHIAVYVGDEMIMHHCHGRLSRRDIYGGFWKKHTTHHLRHQSKC